MRLGSMDLLQGPGLFLDDERLQAGMGTLDGGRIAAVAEQDLALSRLGQDHEFMGHVAADGPGLRLYRCGLQAAALKDPRISQMHPLIGLVQRGFVNVEAVGVLHDEFTGPHDPETGPDLVPELGLDLIEGQGQAFIRADLSPDQVGDHLFMGGAEGELAVVPVGDLHQLLAVNVPPAALLPQLGRMQNGHEQLHRSGGVHLLPDDLLHLADGPVPQRQIGVHSGGQLAHESGADHQLVADHLRLGGIFLLCGNEGLRPAHRAPSGRRPPR